MSPFLSPSMSPFLSPFMPPFISLGGGNSYRPPLCAVEVLLLFIEVNISGYICCFIVDQALSMVHASECAKGPLEIELDERKWNEEASRDPT